MSKVKEYQDESMLSEAYVLMAGLRSCMDHVEIKSEEDWKWMQAVDHWFTHANKQMVDSLKQDFTAAITVASISGIFLAVKDKIDTWEKDERLTPTQKMALIGAAFIELIPLLEGVLSGYKLRN